MLEVVGAGSLDELIERTTPAAIRTERPLALPPAISEDQALAALRALAGRNRVLTSMIGMGYYGTLTPSVILRNVLENPGWYTAYTPYQAEVSQGRLEALLNFQQMVADLTGLELANASLLDEATAAAEAMAMAKRAGRSRADTFFVDADCHPADPRRDPHPRGRVRLRGRGRRSAARSRGPGGVRRAAALPGLERRGARLSRRDRQAARAGRARDHGVRSVEPRPADAAGRARRRHRDRQRPALRRADGLWRPACGVLRHARRLQAADAGPPDRRLGRQPRPAGPAHGAADPRAAHPAREGHQQHLHRPGPARRDRRPVCRLARAAGHPQDRRPGASPEPDPGPGPARRRDRGHDARLLRHDHRAGPGQGRGDRRGGPRARHQSAPGRCRSSRDRARRDHAAARRRAGLAGVRRGPGQRHGGCYRPARWRGRGLPARGAAPDQRLPEPSGLQPAITARPR